MSIIRAWLALAVVVGTTGTAALAQKMTNTNDKDTEINRNDEQETQRETEAYWRRFLRDASSLPPSPPPPPPTVAPTAFPTRSIESQDRLVTCISVIDENDGKNVESRWEALREAYPNRPFCLLRPVPPGTTDGLSFPSTFFNDTANIFSEVTRDGLDATDTSDWYEICNLDAGKPQGLTNVVLFVDNSGSMTTASVQNAFDLFAQRVAANGFQIVTAVENKSEDYIDPCLLTSLLPPTISPIPGPA